jgi:phenylalanyl-tRNA synthetase alpha chain
LDNLSHVEATVLKTLMHNAGKSSVRNLAVKSGLSESAVYRAILTLSQNQLVQERIQTKTELHLTEEGKSFATNGLPERRVVVEIKNSGGRLPLNEALQKAKLPQSYAPIVTGSIKSKKWGEIERTMHDLVIWVPSDPPKGDDERILDRLREQVLILEELPPELAKAAHRLMKRNILKAIVRNEREVEITSVGLQSVDLNPAKQGVSQLTSNMIISGEWEKIPLRRYDVSSPVPQTFPGKYHPYTRFLRSVKGKLVALGFQEVEGPFVETAFVNCDCLFMPQDHPAREIHDLYYLKDPSRTSLEPWKDIVAKVAKTHENGWRTGSKGWRYKYSRDEASKLILRSHGTALSARTLMSERLHIPGKYFAIARCFRPELLDRTHLTEFNQAEGIVVDPSLNLRNLLGILEMFAKEVAGADKVRFKPDYFPFTEPSIELQAYKEGFGWMEFGGSGIFRPEVTLPLGVNVPVLAWGLGIDRLYMMKRGIQDIRQLFTSDLEWIRSQTVS